MRLNQKLIILLLFGISFMTCRKETPEITSNQEDDSEILRDSVLNSWESKMIAVANDIIHNLSGQWAIDSIEIEFRDSYGNSQTGIHSDTTIVNFGQINFGEWELLSTGYPDSTSYENGAELIYENEIFPIKFTYLIHTPGKSEVFSFIDWVLIQGNNNWDTTEGWYLYNVGIFDNIQIVKLSQDEYYFKGLNQGIKKMKLRRI